MGLFDLGVDCGTATGGDTGAVTGGDTGADSGVDSGASIEAAKVKKFNSVIKLI